MDICIKEQIMELDRQFDKDTSVGGAKAWASYFAEDAVMVVAQGEDIKGREAIHEHMSKPFALNGFSLRWEPMDAEFAEDGSLGYTYGKYVRKYIDDTGREVTATGKYTTVWKKQKDGSWKIILDIGN